MAKLKAFGKRVMNLVNLKEKSISKTTRGMVSGNSFLIIVCAMKGVMKIIYKLGRGGGIMKTAN